jgi:hypothetical protein
MESHETGHQHAHDHEIHFSVDGEPEETRRAVWTPNEIINDFGKKDPSTNYLVQIDGHHRVSYQGKGEDPIKIHEGEKFQIISTGPTPVSDGIVKTGVELFVEGLNAQGYVPAVVAGKPDHVVFDYIVQSGSHAGRQVKLGLIIPGDFPLQPPGGPHVSPHIHALNGEGQHPAGRVHASPSFQESMGGQWQYWSRPFPGWATTRKTVAAYMSHIWRLWDSQ